MLKCHLLILLPGQSQQLLPGWSGIHTDSEARWVQSASVLSCYPQQSDHQSINQSINLTLVLQEWSSPSQLWSMGRTWTVVDTNWEWVSSWRRKDSSGGDEERRPTYEKNTGLNVTTKMCSIQNTYYHTHTRKYTHIYIFGLNPETRAASKNLQYCNFLK